MLQINCYLEEEAGCKGVLTSSESPPGPFQISGSFTAACCLAGMCVHTCVSVCVAKMQVTQPPVALPCFIISLC